MTNENILRLDVSSQVDDDVVESIREDMREELSEGTKGMMILGFVEGDG